MIIYDYALSVYDQSPLCLCFGTLEQDCKRFSSTSVVRFASRGRWRDAVGEGFCCGFWGFPSCWGSVYEDLVHNLWYSNLLLLSRKLHLQSLKSIPVGSFLKCHPVDTCSWYSPHVFLEGGINFKFILSSLQPWA